MSPPRKAAMADRLAAVLDRRETRLEMLSWKSREARIMAAKIRAKLQPEIQPEDTPPMVRTEPNTSIVDDFAGALADGRYDERRPIWPRSETPCPGDPIPEGAKWGGQFEMTDEKGCAHE